MIEPTEISFEQLKKTKDKGKSTNYGAGDVVFLGLLDRAGAIWFGTADGLYNYNGKTFTDVSIP